MLECVCVCLRVCVCGFFGNFAACFSHFGAQLGQKQLNTTLWLPWIAAFLLLLLLLLPRTLLMMQVQIYLPLCCASSRIFRQNVLLTELELRKGFPRGGVGVRNKYRTGCEKNHTNKRTILPFICQLNMHKTDISFKQIILKQSCYLLFIFSFIAPHTVTERI